ncbi:YrdB family protein [Actinomadura sp. ATCC 31491]|uniref:YrdB family protein n=1 Tax=Actinomadura luzonensis TaxID=2805427 RepID=A0ABT0G5R7_9ACTN|nr:YrdB family protein [Actinomadura luzonensis]MCK2219962.1 YrdB family protein [Actinomadura luzonensis]
MKHANMALMFFLELGVLAAVGYWGFTLSANWGVKLLAGLGGPALFALVWALFAAGGGANATFPLTGLARAALEIAWFGGGALALYAAGAITPAVVLAGLFILNAVLRLVWKQV